MKKRIICIAMVLCLMLTNIYVYAEVKKDETVYARLNYDGSVAEIKVVNHIYGDNSSDSYTDFGKYTKVKNMTENVEPKINGEEIIWPMELLRDKDIYYEGTIEKELPIQVNIKYYLDGKELAPKDLRGKSGHFKIDINISHSDTVAWDKAGLLTQIQLTPDLDVFSNIKSEGSSVIVGKKANITFVALPPATQSFSLEAEVKNMYLDPVNISVVASSFNLPGDIEAGINELTGGIGKLYAGTSELSKNSKGISLGMEQFHGGLNQMSLQGGQLVGGFSQIAAGMDTLSQKGNELQAGIGQLSGGLKEISTGTKELSGGLNQLTEGHTQLMQLAAMYANSSDPMLRQLAVGIIKEGEGLQTLNAGLKESSSGLEALEAGSSQVQSGFGEYKGGIDKMSGSMKEMNKGMSALPKAIDQLSNSFEVLKGGINKYFNGVNEVNKGVGLINEGTKSISSNFGSSILGSGESNYKSFVDSRNENSTVQFIMRTPSIDRPEVKASDSMAVEVKKSFFERLLDLFRRK